MWIAVAVSGPLEFNIVILTASQCFRYENSHSYNPSSAVRARNQSCPPRQARKEPPGRGKNEFPESNRSCLLTRKVSQKLILILSGVGKLPETSLDFSRWGGFCLYLSIGIAKLQSAILS